MKYACVVIAAAFVVSCSRRAPEREADTNAASHGQATDARRPVAGGTPANDDSLAFLKFPERQVPARVFLVGIDGATWDVLDAAMKDGLMPNLAQLVSDGSRGVLESMDPTASAIVWTTIATGKKPRQHGVHGFVVNTPEGKTVPVSSTVRRVKALWNIASEAGVSVGFLSWWVTWPAEPVRGYMCSDYTWPARKDELGFATGSNAELNIPYRTYPPDLMSELEPYIKTEARLTPGELESLGLSTIPTVENYAIRDIMLKDVSVGRMADYLLPKFHPALSGTYFDGFDAFSHIFWSEYQTYYRARTSGADLNTLAPQIRLLGEALDAHLKRIDASLGAIRRLAGPDDVVMVLSDHGYGDNPSMQPVQRGYNDWITPPHWHTLRGIIAAAGGPIRKDVRGVRASVVDIAPTVLALLGLPVGKDMDGRVLTSLLTPEFLKAHPVRTIDTYDLRPRTSVPLGSEYDAGMKARLQALGYIDKDEK